MKVPLNYLKTEGAWLTPNGAKFKNDAQGFLPEMMEKMYNDRVVYKKRMLKAKQQYDEALRNMNIAATNNTIDINDNVTTDNLSYDNYNDNDDLDEYLPNVEDYVENIEEKPISLNSSIENIKNIKDGAAEAACCREKDARLYEFLILFTIGMVIIFLCEILVRLASS